MSVWPTCDCWGLSKISIELKSEVNTAVYKLPLNPRGWRGVKRFSVYGPKYIFLRLFGQSCSGEVLQFLWLSGTNKSTVTPALHNVWHGVSKCENDRAVRTNSDLHTFFCDSAGHFHCRNTPTPLLLHLCSATALHYNAVLSQILPLSNNCSFKWFGYCTQAHYNFDYILIDFAALIFP